MTVYGNYPLYYFLKENRQKPCWKRSSLLSLHQTPSEVLKAGVQDWAQKQQHTIQKIPFLEAIYSSTSLHKHYCKCKTTSFCSYPWKGTGQLPTE